MLQWLVKIMNVIINIFDRPECCPSGRFDYKVGPCKTKKPKTCMLELSITNEQKIPVTLSPKTATGKPASVDGAPTWEVITGNSTVVPSPDGLSAELISSDDPGDTDVLIKADADLGAGVVEISDIIRLTVVGALAANLGLTAGTPVAK